MLIEIHMIQNHSPSNLNRDDLGAPKTCYFGGVLRSRISSQCLKRSIRNPGNPEDIHNHGPGIFAKAMSAYMGTRTRFFPWLVGSELKDSNIPPEEHRRVVLAAQRIAVSKEKENAQSRTESRDPRPRTPQLIFLGPKHASNFVKRLVELRAQQKDCYDYFLNPRVGFEEMVREFLVADSVGEKDIDKIVKASWLVAKCRMNDLLKPAAGEEPDAEPEKEDNQPGAAHAKLVAERLEHIRLSDSTKFKALTKPANPTERTEVKEDAPKEPKEFDRFTEALKSVNSRDAVDIALFGRMTTSDAFQDVEAAMQVAHAISTHEARLGIDYFTTVDDLGKAGGGAGHVGETIMDSPCFYKYFSLDWKQLVHNLAGPEPNAKEHPNENGKWNDETLPQAERLAAVTLGNFVNAAAREIPTGKRNSTAPNNLPSGILIEFRDTAPISYANAFVTPAAKGERDLVAQSIAQLGQYVHDMDVGYGDLEKPPKRYWFSPNLQHRLQYQEKDGDKTVERNLAAYNIESLPKLVESVVKEIGFDWREVQKTIASS